MDNIEIEMIRKTYPKIISKDQVYRICHISKATALYLLQSGLIPCTNSGKKTRKYRVELEDVITYLQKREICPIEYKPPEGYYKDTSQPTNRHRRHIHIPMKRISDARTYLEEKLRNYDEVMTTAQVSQFLGYSQKTVVSWHEKKETKSFMIKGRLMFPKEYLIDFIVSDRCNYISQKSNNHFVLIKEFLYNT